MKRYLFLVGVLLLTASTTIAQELKLDEILEKHLKASGLEKLQSVNTIIMTGTVIRNDAMPIKVYKVRPNKYRLENDVMDITGLQVFDGQNGWTTAPWTGNAQPQVANGPTLIDLKIRADFDGILYSWKAKGHSAELIGKEKIGDKDVYKIKLTRNDGGIEFYLIDCNSFLLLRKISYRLVRGNEMEVVSNFIDYRNIEGVMFAFTNQNLMGGQPYSTIQFETIELNKSIDEKIFVMPATK